MKERIKRIRKDLKLTQAEFGAKIGVRGNTITNYEAGLRTPSDAVIVSICREFGVNREWLLSGEGEPYIPEDATLSTLVSKITDGDDDFIKDLIVAYMELDEVSKEAIRVLAKKMADKQNKRKRKQSNPPAVSKN